MVLEAIFTATEARRHPLKMLAFAALVNSVALWTAFFVFPGSASVISIAFLTIALVPLIHSTLRKEEKEEAHHEHHGLSSIFFIRHLTVLQVYAWFFLGLMLSYSFWYVAMPSDAREHAFFEQEKTLSAITSLRENLTGAFALKQGACGKNAFCWGEVIFVNNAKVLLLSVLFSLIYGAGAIFLIAWQASVIGTLIGTEVIKLAAVQPGATGLAIIPYYALGFATSFLGLAPHGIPEAMGYFIGAIAGGIISAAITKKHFHAHEVKVIGKDAIILVAIALALLIIGAWIEATAIAGSISG